MKNLFFSTMAVLAFSVSGMANTIELEVVSTNIEKEIQNIKKASDLHQKDIDEERGLNCFEVASAAEFSFYVVAFVLGFPPDNEMLYSVFSAAYDSCMSSRGGNDLTILP